MSVLRRHGARRARRRRRRARCWACRSSACAGIYPALATLAFALMFESVLVPLDWVSGRRRPAARCPGRSSAPIDFAGDRPFLAACASSASPSLGVAVIAIRQGTTGRFLDAIRGQRARRPRRSASTPTARGSSPSSPAPRIAGFGGGLIASFNGQANYDPNFTFYFGLVCSCSSSWRRQCFAA